MQAPTYSPTDSGGTQGQYYAMGSTSQPAGAGGCTGVCGSTAGQQPTGRSPQQPADQQRQPGLDSNVAMSGDFATSLSGLFAPGDLDREDAILLWTGVNSLLFAYLVYKEINR